MREAESASVLMLATLGTSWPLDASIEVTVGAIEGREREVGLSL